MNKKLILTLIIISFTLVGFSQSKNVQNAFNSFRQENISEAKYFIDLAVNNETTANDAKMWNYRAKIYLEIMQKHPEIDVNAVFEATEAHIRCLDRDKKGRIAVRKWTREEEEVELDEDGNPIVTDKTTETTEVNNETKSVDSPENSDDNNEASDEKNTEE